MEEIIIVKHGHAENNSLTDLGTCQINLLSEILKQHLNLTKSQTTQQQIAMLIANNPIASATAKIIIDKLNKEGYIISSFEKNNLWISEYSHREDDEVKFRQTIKDLNEINAKVSILISNFGYIEEFPRYFAKHMLNCDFPSLKPANQKFFLENGEAVAIENIDNENTRLSILRPHEIIVSGRKQN